MPPECEEIEDRGVPEKISCIDGRIKEHLRFASPTLLCGVCQHFPRSIIFNSLHRNVVSSAGPCRASLIFIPATKESGSP